MSNEDRRQRAYRKHMQDVVHGQGQRACHEQPSSCVLPANLRYLRQYHGYRQEDIAAHLGICRNMYVRYESGESSPSADKLAAMAGLYQIPLRILTGQRLSGRSEASSPRIPGDIPAEQISRYEQLTTVSKYAIIEMMRMLQQMEDRVYGVRTETEK